MKKRTFLLALVLTALVFVGYAVAAGGDASDPLVSLDFLNGTFRRQAEKRIDEAVTKARSTTPRPAGMPRSRRRRPLSAPTTPPSLPKRASSRTTSSPASRACKSSLSPVS